jgi:acetoin:2,6-dichlorophenolindophenol oxidoreductase subunit beta
MSSGSAQQLEKNLGTAATVDGKRMMFTAACAAAIREEMDRDERVFIMGEDIEEAMLGRTSGLLERFGPSRVRNTPISEAAFMGAGTGAAATGMIPIVDLFMSNFLYVAADQLLNNANKLRYMMGGQVTLPMTILASTGAPGAIGAQHSDAPYAQVINGGGVKVVIPTNPADLKGLLKSAIRDPNPVLVLLPMALGSVSGEVPQDEYLIPLGKGSVLREGTDVTIVAIGAMVRRAVAAAKELDAAGISAEVIDPRTLHPLDDELLVSSVGKTGRLVVVDEARRSCSMASEIVARVSSTAFDSLRAAPRIVANPDVHVPYAQSLEVEVIPQVSHIVAAAHQVVSGKEAG